MVDREEAFRVFQLFNYIRKECVSSRKKNILNNEFCNNCCFVSPNVVKIRCHLPVQNNDISVSLYIEKLSGKQSCNC